ncbi:MAG TPA: hypothetical protein VMT61_09645 [Candidatus Binataceae bacterium]|nr:hypothetical protein [Candidatus Binataceae bacterium]
MATHPWKMPPLIKVYEALGAIADGRVRILDDVRAEVGSSEGNKTYTVELNGKEVAANDNASYWQGYLGYPAIAVMIARGMLDAYPKAIEALGGIAWKELNRRYRNDYAKTIAEVDDGLRASGIEPDEIKRSCESVLALLEAFAPIRGARKRPPRAQ